MPEQLPTGTVSFLLTDIEGSTHMWRENPEAMLRAVTRHREIIHESILGHGGRLPRDQGEGDSVFAAFGRATDAVAATLAMQRRLATEEWPERLQVRVRAAIHTGEVELRGDNYYGTTVSRTARIRALAWGGQTLVSLATYQLVRDHLPEGCAMKELGSYHLKDFEGSETIYQLCSSDIPSDFPPLQLREIKPHNLPLFLTKFVGRRADMAELKELLHSARLVTLTGPGGSGKTRLAVEAAREVMGDFEDGVHLVDLAPVDDSNLVASTITRSLGIHENPGSTSFESVGQHLEDKHMLLILDSFERVIDAASVIGEMLARCPRLVGMVTSRASLRLRGEREFPVPPLAVPAPEHERDAESVTRSEAVQLFVERAQAADFSFDLAPEDVPTVAEICRQLDGLPLAIELAAVRIKILPLPQLLKRLTGRLELLKGGARDLPARQQTLRNLIDWDYELLDEDDQACFRRLAVCAGGFTLDAVAATAAIPELQALEAVQSLLAKSLLRRTSPGSEEPRFRMLETIREYGLDVLVATGEAEDTRRRHAEYYLRLAEEGSSHLRSADQVERLRALDEELDNMRAALRWAHEQPDTELELRLAGALAPFWAFRGHAGEGRRWVEAALGRSTGVATLHRANVLRGAATLARARGSYQQAEALLEECIALQRKLGDDEGLALSLNELANVRSDQGDLASARPLYEESLEYWRRTGSDPGIARVLNNLGVIAHVSGDLEGAVAALEESLRLSRQLRDKQGIARVLMNLGTSMRFLGDVQRGGSLLTESLVLWRELGDKWDVADCLEELAAVYVEQDKWEGAASVFGAAEALREAIGARRSPLDDEAYQATVARVRERLAPEDLADAWEHGRGLDMEAAIDFALGQRQALTAP